MELDAVRALLRDDFVAITVGGGGIPVVADEHGDLHGVAAVIDKDFASALLDALDHPEWAGCVVDVAGPPA